MKTIRQAPHSNKTNETRKASKNYAPTDDGHLGFYKKDENYVTVYVGNLSYHKTELDIKKMFGEFGYVSHVRRILDPATKQSKGIAFVQMKKLVDAHKAIKNFNGQQVDGRTLKVSIAQERDFFKKLPSKRPAEKKIKKKKFRGLDLLLDRKS